MNNEPTSKKPGQLEQLVAYLDGELNDEQSAAMEKRLSENPKLREAADELDRTWSMLDVLGPVTVGEEFSQKTMQTVVTTCSLSEQSSRPSFGKLLFSFATGQALVWFGIGVLGTLVGLGLAGLRSPSKESIQAMQLLRQIDMLDRYPQYSIIPDVESLQQLQFPPQTDAETTSPKQEVP